MNTTITKTGYYNGTINTINTNTPTIITISANNKQQEKNILGYAFTYCGASLVSISLYTITLSLPNTNTLCGVLADDTTKHINHFTTMLSNNTIHHTITQGK